VDDGSTVIWRGTTAVTQAAGTTQIYELLPQAIPTGNVNGVALMALPPEGLLLRRGWRLRTTTTLIDVGDQYSAISLYAQELPDGPTFKVDPTMPSYAAALDG
jgi:hypothetical protein